ncbi:hypothetical protein PAAG_11137 [Paracoccidioides lutzii Pb01]|uniref:Uncharacterized protein n=1 Tax=Paracoccidioides lutzii (strain ATCC MYA-826 / Pb01) TaxID=502779 RepID=A0A0A2V358_PARBA|nr:hypothetical protein PAAG_11137 [Paracoccidioides lutzii Pb01]KGQ02181.1 hypothetical protein PAAG_11137 [Paracoccidioides lutzii Pb01]
MANLLERLHHQFWPPNFLSLHSLSIPPVTATTPHQQIPMFVSCQLHASGNKDTNGALEARRTGFPGQGSVSSYFGLYFSGSKFLYEEELET